MKQCIHRWKPRWRSPLPKNSSNIPKPQTVFHLGRPRAIQWIDEKTLSLCPWRQEESWRSPHLPETSSSRGPFCCASTEGTQHINEKALREAFGLGGDRTFEQDPKYALRLLVDIAIKALSPAVNDPTTAVQALDQIEDLLRRLGSRRLEIGLHATTAANSDW